jgi:hypothetical protein
LAELEEGQVPFFLGRRHGETELLPGPLRGAGGRIIERIPLEKLYHLFPRRNISDLTGVRIVTHHLHEDLHPARIESDELETLFCPEHPLVPAVVGRILLTGPGLSGSPMNGTEPGLWIQVSAGTLVKEHPGSIVLQPYLEPPVQQVLPQSFKVSSGLHPNPFQGKALAAGGVRTR